MDDRDELGGNGAGIRRAADRQSDDTPGLRTVRSADLFANAREIVIDHCGDRYRLRCTSKGKLILTK
ncbi:MAG: hemin uptake protein HemP [Minwuiales bacterium]|nr:hemin uptake protein HemP [Minwuiales bacterium]